MPLIPQRILENLRCSICGGYLSSKPLMVKSNDQQVCGKCYKILPTAEKQNCIRQIGLESLAEVLVFPCRYDSQGCDHTFNWCDEQNHETECPYRTLIDMGSKPPVCRPKNKIECETELVRAVLKYEVKENKYSNELKKLTYSLKIRGIGYNAIAIRNMNCSGTEMNRDCSNVELCLEGDIFLGSKSEVISSDIKIESLVQENIYQDLKSDKLCSHCKVTLDDMTQNHCLLGHIYCTNCKEKMCIQCVYILENKSIAVCKNYQRGCEKTLRFDQLHHHQIDCPYNDFQCPLKLCSRKGTLPWLKQHLQIDHTEEVIFNNMMSKKYGNKDDSVIIVCYGNIFRCVYYYYRTFVEFFVTHLGSSTEASKFSYKLIVTSGVNDFLRMGQCSNWNDVMLQKGISFEKDELINENDRKLNFDGIIRILNDG